MRTKNPKTRLAERTGPLRFGHVLLDHLPKRVRQLLDRDDQFRWRFEGHTRGLLDSSTRGLDCAIASILAQRGLPPEEIVAGLLHSRRERGLTEEIEPLLEIAASAWRQQHGPDAA